MEGTARNRGGGSLLVLLTAPRVTYQGRRGLGPQQAAGPVTSGRARGRWREARGCPGTHPRPCRICCRGPPGSQPHTRTCSCPAGSRRAGCTRWGPRTRQYLRDTEEIFLTTRKEPCLCPAGLRGARLRCPPSRWGGTPRHSADSPSQCRWPTRRKPSGHRHSWPSLRSLQMWEQPPLWSRHSLVAAPGGGGGHRAVTLLRGRWGVTR